LAGICYTIITEREGKPLKTRKGKQMFDLYYTYEDRFDLVDTYTTEEEATAAGEEMAREFVDSDEGYAVTAHGELPLM